MAVFKLTRIWELGHIHNYINMQNYIMWKLKGANILVLENGEDIIFFMNYKRNNFIFCGARKGKLSDIQEEEIYSVWEENFDMVIAEETILIDCLESETDEIEDKGD